MSIPMRIYVGGIVAGLSLGVGLGLLWGVGTEGWAVGFVILLFMPLGCLSAIFAQRALHEALKAS
ncbi:MAG: hypothetical protein QM703_26285 [Gemmatales bacterium]